MIITREELPMCTTCTCVLNILLNFTKDAKAVSFEETKNSLGSVLMVDGTIAMSEVGQRWGRELARDTS